MTIDICIIIADCQQLFYFDYIYFLMMLRVRDLVSHYSGPSKMTLRPFNLFSDPFFFSIGLLTCLMGGGWCCFIHGIIMDDDWINSLRPTPSSGHIYRAESEWSMTLPRLLSALGISLAIKWRAYPSTRSQFSGSYFSRFNSTDYNVQKKKVFSENKSSSASSLKCE
jgi:hypothetical protein